MKRITKKQRRERRKKKKVQYKRARVQKGQKQSVELQPWERPKMHIFRMPQMLPANVSKEERLAILKSIGAEAEKDFQQKYPQIKKWFEEYDSLYILSFCSYYLVSMPEGIDLEATEEQIFHHHYLEIMQAFSLSTQRNYKPNPLLEDGEKLERDLIEIGRAMSLRYLNLPDELTTDDEIFAYKLRTEMMMQTASIRNWAYYHQMKRVTLEIAQLIRSEFIEFYGVDPTLFIKALFTLAEERDVLLHKHQSNVQKFIKMTDYKQLITTYQQAFPKTEKLNSTEMEKLWTYANKEIQQLQAMLVHHSDLQLPTIYTFDIDRFTQHYGDTSKKKELKAIIDKLSYKFGDLAKSSPEHFILNNPVHHRPFIEMESGQYFSAVFGIFPHLSLGILEGLISEVGVFQEKYEREIKPGYLEDQLNLLSKKAFPNAKIYRNIKWHNPDDNKDYETDLIVVLDTFILVIEAKAGKISPRAQRGDPISLFKTLARLIEEPSEQAHRLISLLKADQKNHIFSCKGGTCEIDSLNAKYFIPLGVTFSHLGQIGSNLKKLIQAKITTKSIQELAPSISFTDLECVFELLPLEAEKMHYLARRREIEDHIEYEGDEIDLLGLYLDNGFNIGEEEYKGELFLNMLMKSKELDPYFVGTNEGKNVDKPRLSMSEWWWDILNTIARTKPKKWLETSFILLNSTKEDQINFAKDVAKLIAMIKGGKAKNKHNWVAFLSGPERRRYLIVGYPYTTIDKEERDRVMGDIAISEHSKNVRGAVIIGIDINQANYPYSVIAGRLDTDLFDNGER